MNRKENLAALKNNYFDICVIGAGASGAGVALDAALRGFKVALIDQGDFSGETSSKSTKLIHGGVRYLEQAFKKLDISFLKQVAHGLAERQYLLANAPHLTKPLGIVTPVFSWFEGLYYTIGLKIYGLFAKNDHLPEAKWLSKKQAFAFCPDLNPKVHSAVMYYDGQLNDAKFALALTQSANKEGTKTVNYAKVLSFNFDVNGKIESANVKDEIENDDFIIKSKLFVNCTGPFADSIRLLANPSENKRIVPSKGVHFLMPKSFFEGEKAMLIPKTKDGRLIFVIPFQSEIMVGTTDTPCEISKEEPQLIREEAKFLLETLEPFVNKMPDFKDIKAGFGGLRPLLLPRKSNDASATKTLLRDHEVEVDSTSGLLSLMGGKWTTYRLMAQDTVDQIERMIEVKRPVQTHSYKLIGAQNPDFSLISSVKEAAKHEFSEATLGHLFENYGDQLPEILKICDENANNSQLIHANYAFINAEIIYACRFEMAIKLRDFCARRIRFELLDWQATLESIPKIAEVMAAEMGWNETQKNEEQKAYKKILEGFQNSLNS